ncbi:O-antigen polymerase [Aeromonas veronii]|uniref:O-antigen polymerase n=1 Tax=Aeromonas veronii TaxID=654 RepID=UPI0027DB4748|nr:O-antigen polymerase [Aeromonas veronii]WMJ03801.1 O-antigen polymerase [Aeromonas veronii]
MNLISFSICGVIYFSLCMLFPFDVSIGLLFVVFVSQVIVIRYSQLRYESPVIWYSTAVFIYHFSSLFLYYVGFYNFENIYSSSIIYGLIYYFSVIPLFFCRRFNVDNELYIRFDKYFDKKIIFIVYVVSFLMVILANVYFFKSGFSNKGDAILSGGTKFNFIYNWANIAALLFLIRYRDSKLFYYAMGYSFIICTFTSLNTGERNVILSYALSVIILLVLFEKISRRKSIVLFISIASCIPILQELKTVFSKDIVDVFSSSDALPFYVKLLQGEFRSASRNIDWLLSREHEYNITYGVNIIKDIVVGVSPINMGLTNSQTWFNTTFFPHVVETGQGYGFSIYGSFYIAFYWPGLIIFALLYSSIIVGIFNKARNNVFLFLLSILMITPLIYAQRGDLSVSLAFITKQTLLPLVLIYLTSRFSKGIMSK